MSALQAPALPNSGNSHGIDIWDRCDAPRKVRIAAAGPALPFPQHWGFQTHPCNSSVSTTSLLPLPEAWGTWTSSQSPRTDPETGWERKTTGCPGEECPVGSKHYQHILVTAKTEDSQLHMTPHREWMRKDEGTFLACGHSLLLIKQIYHKHLASTTVAEEKADTR